MQPLAFSIGFYREDGDFQLLATLNNSDELLSPETFETLRLGLMDKLAVALGEFIELEALQRQDAPDYLEPLVLNLGSLLINLWALHFGSAEEPL